VAGAAAFFAAWYLMPLPGTTDAAFILEQVGAAGARVFWSSALQVVSAALLVPPLLALIGSAELRNSAAAFGFASLAGIGATGLAADAIYHLLAFEMTLPGVPREPMLPLMERFQGPDLVFVAPQLLAFVLGFGLLTGSAARAGLASRVSPRLALAALAVGVVGGAAVRAAGSGRRAVALGVLALFSLSLAELGRGLLVWARPSGPGGP